jgi:hypothetical protein
MMMLEKVKRLIFGQSETEKGLVKSTEKKEKGSSKCSQHFGYLGSLPNYEPIPQECLTCQKMLECRNTPKIV